MRESFQPNTESETTERPSLEDYKDDVISLKEFSEAMKKGRGKMMRNLLLAATLLSGPREALGVDSHHEHIPTDVIAELIVDQKFSPAEAIEIVEATQKNPIRSASELAKELTDTEFGEADNIDASVVEADTGRTNPIRSADELAKELDKEGAGKSDYDMTSEEGEPLSPIRSAKELAEKLDEKGAGATDNIQASVEADTNPTDSIRSASELVEKLDKDN